MPGALYSIDTNPTEKFVALGLANGATWVIQYDFDQENQEFEAYGGDFETRAIEMVEHEERKKLDQKKG